MKVEIFQMDGSVPPYFQDLKLEVVLNTDTERWKDISFRWRVIFHFSVAVSFLKTHIEAMCVL